MNHTRRSLLKGIGALGAYSMLPFGIATQAFAYTDQNQSISDSNLLSHISRLANYGTFGPNKETMNEILTSGWEEWVNAQLELSPTLLYPATVIMQEKPTRNQFYSAWWTNAICAQDQLNQRVGFALSQWFVISSDHPYLSGRIWTVIDYYDMMLSGIDSNFQDLLFSVSTHPAMCAYLSSLYNEKADEDKGTIPDENYAREMMQLFSCGAERRNRNGNFTLDNNGEKQENYTEEDVSELARVFTGISVKDAKSWGHETGDWLSPVVEVSSYHDGGSKEFMGQTIAAGQSLEDDVRASIEIILQKCAYSVAGNFCKFMIQRLTVSNPHQSYVADISNALINSGWSIKEMVRAIMLHPDAVDGKEGQYAETGRIKEPLFWYSSARRAINSDRDNELDPISGPFFNNSEPSTRTTFNQVPLEAPSVFGFFPFDYQPNSIKGEGTTHIDYVAPESYLYNWNNVIQISNKMWGNFIIKSDDVDRFITMLEGGSSDVEFIDYVLQEILFNNYRNELREELILLLAKNGATQYNAKLRDTFMVVFLSPDFLCINVEQESHS